MRIRIELADDLDETELVIRCADIDEEVRQLQRLLTNRSSPPPIVFYREDREFYFSLQDVLFFESGDEQVFAHTGKEAYRVKFRLYELEELLPGHFMRVAKSTIVNTRQIFSIARNITSASCVRFRNTHKEIYVSRRYYPQLKEHMEGKWHEKE